MRRLALTFTIVVTVGCGSSTGRRAPLVSTSVSEPEPVPALGASLSFTDDFGDGRVAPEWTIPDTSQMLRVVETAGVLRIQGSASTPGAMAAATLSPEITVEAGEMLSISVRLRQMRVPGSQESTTRIQLVQDPDNYLAFGRYDAPNGAIYYQTSIDGLLTQSLLGGTMDENFHTYRIVYGNGIARLFFDGARVAEVPIELSALNVWLSSHSFYAGPGSVLGEFDEVSVSLVRE